MRHAIQVAIERVDSRSLIPIRPLQLRLLCRVLRVLR